MKTRIGLVAGMLLLGVVVVVRAQPPAEKAEQVARLRARVEVAEVKKEAARAILKESILLLKRAERDLPLERNRSDREHKEQTERLRLLKQYVEAEQERFEQQAIDLESARRELSKATQVTQSASPSRLGTGSQSATRPAAEDPDRLVREVENAQLSADLLQAQLTPLGKSLHEQANTLAALELHAGGDEGKGDGGLAKELDAARKRYADLRDRYVELKTRHARELRTVSRHLHQLATGPGF